VLPKTFQVQWLDDTVGFPTTGADADADSDNVDSDSGGWEPASPAASIQVPGGGGSPQTPP